MQISTQIAKFIGPTWVPPVGSLCAPRWPHEPCYRGKVFIIDNDDHKPQNSLVEIWMCICLLVLAIPVLENTRLFFVLFEPLCAVLAFYNEHVDIGYWTWAILLSNIAVISSFIPHELHDVFIWIQGMFTEKHSPDNRYWAVSIIIYSLYIWCIVFMVSNTFTGAIIRSISVYIRTF